MFDRARIISENFKKFLDQEVSPVQDCNGLSVPEKKLVEIFESQILSRLLDLEARKLKAQGKSFYTIGSSGHEGMAVVGEVSRLTDMAFLHYRDAAFMIQRSKKLPGHTILNDMLSSFCASCEDPISGGRHKVLGHKDLFIPPQTSTIASHLPKAVGTALSIPKMKRLGLRGVLPEDSVVVCTFGDASLNHASAQTALNCADWISYQKLPLPLVFICEDNGIGISVRTPEDWVRNSRNGSPAVKYYECNGLHLLQSYETVKEAFSYSRKNKRPVFIRFKTTRLMGHAGSDIENVYLTNEMIEANEKNDPLLVSARILIEHGIMSSYDIRSLYADQEKRVERVSSVIVLKPRLTQVSSITSSLIPVKEIRSLPPVPPLEDRKIIFGAEWEQLKNKHPMAKLINAGLTDILLRFKEALIFGEDVAKKGGVYNVTANLEKRFGKNKVFNSLLDETSILGAAIGMAHNGFLPIPEIQFLAYVHNAEDQIRGEAATLSYFSNGQYTNGMVIRIAGLGYQKGFGGHFHNDNSLSVFRDLPGIIIACPSNGRDAVMMMRSCVREAYEFGKVCIFIEPIALYPMRDLHAPGDNLWMQEYPSDLNEEIPIGEFSHIEGTKELCLLSYGNGHYLCQQAKKILEEQHGISPSLIDLRWLAPLDENKLAKTLSTYRHVLVVDECRKTGSLSEGLFTMMLEKCSSLPKIKRVTSHDTFIPLADAANLVLVSRDDIVDASLELIRGLR